MIQQRAEALVALLERRRKLGGEARQLQGFQTQHRAVQETLGLLTPIVGAWHLLRERGIIDLPAPDVAATRRKLLELRERFSKEPASILGPKSIPIKQDAAALVAQLRPQLLEAWGAYGRTMIPNVQKEVLDVLGRIPVIKPQIDRIRQGLSELNSHLLQLPSAAGELDAFAEQAAVVRAIWNAFDSAHLPPDVWVFLKNAAGAGAALDSLTESVKQWLGAHDLLAAFRIRSTTN
jgi:hypothetical protein